MFNFKFIIKILFLYKFKMLQQINYKNIILSFLILKIIFRCFLAFYES